jgi:hypothetical protein
MGDLKTLTGQLANQGVGVEGLSVRFTLPLGAKIVSGGMAYDVKTMDGPLVRTDDEEGRVPAAPWGGAFYWDRCYVRLDLSNIDLRISIEPALIIDPFMIREYGLSGLTYTFAAKNVTSGYRGIPGAVLTAQGPKPQWQQRFDNRPNTGPLYDYVARKPQTFAGSSSGPALIPFPSSAGDLTDIRLFVLEPRLSVPIHILSSLLYGTVKDKVRDAFMHMIRGTRYTKSGYLPLQDPDPMGGLREIQANMTSAPNSPTVNIALTQLNGFQASGWIRSLVAIKRESGGNAVEIPEGLNLRVTIDLLGSGRHIFTQQLVGFSELLIETLPNTVDGIYLVKGGERVVLLRKLSVSRGGVVTVIDWEPLGSLARTLDKTAGVEILLRAFAGIIRTNAISAGDATPRSVGQRADSTLDDELTKAIRQVIAQNYTMLQHMARPYDFQLFMGIDARGQPTQQVLAFNA